MIETQGEKLKRLEVGDDSESDEEDDTELKHKPAAAEVIFRNKKTKTNKQKSAALRSDQKRRPCVDLCCRHCDPSLPLPRKTHVQQIPCAGQKSARIVQCQAAFYVLSLVMNWHKFVQKKTKTKGL